MIKWVCQDRYKNVFYISILLVTFYSITRRIYYADMNRRFLKEGIHVPTRKSWKSKKNSPVEEFQVFLKSTPGFWLRCVIVGRQYDSKGKLKDWWEPYTVELFRETTTCMKDQYNGFKLEGLQVSVAGSVKSLYNSLSSGTFTMNC